MASTEVLTMPSRMRPSLLTDVSPVHSRGDIRSDAHASSSAPPATNEFTRSASYTYLPSAREAFPSSVPQPLSIKGTFSEEDLFAVPEDAERALSTSSGWSTPEEFDARLQSERIAAQGLVFELQNSANVSAAQLYDQHETRKGNSISIPEKKNSMRQRSIASISSANSRTAQRSSTGTTESRKQQRKSWYSIATTPDSRSPSPAKRAAVNTGDGDEILAAVEESPITRNEPNDPLRRNSDISIEDFPPLDEVNEVEETPLAEILQEEPVSRPSTSRRSSIFKRPLSGIFGRNASVDEGPAPALPAIPKSFSTDRLPTLASATLSANRSAPAPRLGSVDKTNNAKPNAVRKKDELWSIFRTLDADYTKFASKSVALKTNVIRSSLVPFLQAYADHPSTYMLRPEDLDRRTNILNKWWTGLTEMLHGRNNQSVHGTDRPTILDGICGIMERPEWRLSSPFCSLDRRLRNPVQTRSTTSLSSLASETLHNTVHQSVRDIFVQNLRSQMAFVVDKMSLRQASASLVSFCGKACAYAFMFVPGMADVLVRLWDLQADILRRVLAENDVERFGNLSATSDDMITHFPPCLGNLAFTTLAEFNRKLRTPPPLPTGTTNIQWWGYWLERWTGRESDLFYVFVKHYHILVADFLPPGSTREERVCVPGMLLVHGQILSNLDATIHRQTARIPEVTPANADISSVDPDAVGSALPVPPMNATRHMQENRLIMLMRDFLSDRATSFPAARQIFAESFNDLLQAAARGVCLYDPASCYILLDLLEEALVILAKYEHVGSGVGSIINPDFWQLVSRRMIASENTLTEIRLYAFLYTIWNHVVTDLGRKADLCLNLLLDPAVFASRFNHWSPMVRAYYMRLICWRVARYDGEPQPGDFDILETLLERLQMTWCHFLWLREQAVNDHSLIPQTSPSNPAPHRRLRIVRTDAHVTPGAFPAFDVIIPPMISPAKTPRPKSKRLSTLSSVAELESQPTIGDFESPDSDSAPGSPSGIRSLFRTGTRSRPKSQSSVGSMTPTFDSTTPLPRRPDGTPALLRAATAELISGREKEGKAAVKSTTVAAGDTEFRTFSFKFAMEFNTNIKQPGPLRLVPPRLPAPAQKLMSEVSALNTSHLYKEIVRPTGIAKKRVTYNGRALAEWALIVGECQSFFDRRRNEGVPENKFVETPTLGVEIFKRPG